MNPSVLLCPAKLEGQTKNQIDTLFGDCYYASHPAILAQVKESDFGNKLSFFVSCQTYPTNIPTNDRFMELVGKMKEKEYLSDSEKGYVTEMFNEIMPAISNWFDEKRREIQAQTKHQVLFSLYTIGANERNYFVRFGHFVVGEGRWEWDLEAYNT